ncbi:MAG: hypothetical protein NTV34_08155 [Proteobacteria bacterium]|nr:hypothetical protein [Pseudomonadota bacterium]
MQWILGDPQVQGECHAEIQRDPNNMFNLFDSWFIGTVSEAY